MICVLRQEDQNNAEAKRKDHCRTYFQLRFCFVWEPVKLSNLSEWAMNFIFSFRKTCVKQMFLPKKFKSNRVKIFRNKRIDVNNNIVSMLSRRSQNSRETQNKDIKMFSYSFCVGQKLTEDTGLARIKSKTLHDRSILVTFSRFCKFHFAIECIEVAELKNLLSREIDCTCLNIWAYR